VLAIGDVYV